MTPADSERHKEHDGVGDSRNASVTAVSSSSGNNKLKFDDVRDLVLSEEIRRRESGEASSSSALHTGASFHSIPCQEIVENYVSGDFGKVQLADDETLKIVGKGNIRLKLPNQTTWKLKGAVNRRLPKEHSSLLVAWPYERERDEYTFVKKEAAGSKEYRCSLYYITFIDDSTRKVWVYFLKKKSEVFDTFRKWKVMVENESGLKVKRLRSDNGGEYKNKRMNKTLNKRAISMRIHVGLPKLLWAEAINTAAYLVNRGPSVPLDGGIPNEVWGEKEINLSHLRVFGCISYVHINSAERSKLDAKSNKCVFVGYGGDEFGYQFWDYENQKIIRSRDVIFNENVMYKDISVLNKFKKNQVEDSVKWESSMKDEMDSLMSNYTYELAELPPIKKALHNKWIYRIKKSTMGANATKQDWLSKVFSKQKQLDVKTYFLHGDLEEEIYMRQPKGFIEARKKNLAKYINKVLFKFNMEDAKQPDIAHAVGAVSRYMNNPGKVQWEAVKWIIRYLRQEGRWDLQMLDLGLDNDTIQLIAAVLPPDDDAGEDIPTWRWEVTDSNEIILHVLRDCVLVRLVWNEVVPNNLLSFFVALLEEWLEENLFRCSRLDTHDFYWRHLLGIIIWRLWKQRNNFKFKGEAWSSFEVIKSTWSWAQTLCSAKREASVVHTRGVTNQRWRPPSLSGITINTDGAVNRSSMETAYEGVIRDNDGHWLLGFRRKYGHNGEVNYRFGLHAEYTALGKSFNDRFLVVCLDDISLYLGGVEFNDPQRKLVLPIPSIPFGHCPPVGNLTQLLKLDLSSNGFSGKIPESLSNLQDLEFLDLSFNSFGNFGVPLFIAEMPRLKDVHLSGNLLGGEIPEKREKLGGVLRIGFSGMGLVWKIPASMGIHLRYLCYLGLDNNRLQGKVPEEFVCLEFVNELNLENNNLSGRVPFSAEFTAKIGEKLRFKGNQQCVLMRN
ncbi:TBC1 domain family member 15-like [Hibiscus syriacus]|uniref:TBC1 domain family member 15-like n=1 Tax=Hibiscus syriacus TaxID=106335 RepID=A0A6A2XGA5_HIBSY|nr:TBC1 domain family member 15-like [Hibiscus syriacus]